MRRVPRRHTAQTVPWCPCPHWRDGFKSSGDPAIWVHAKCGLPTRWVWEKHVAGRAA